MALTRDWQKSLRMGFAKGTQHNLKMQETKFKQFCKRYQLTAFPASVHTICLFAQHLAYSLAPVESIANYIHGIKTLHSILELDIRPFEHKKVHLTLRGLR